MLVSQRLLESAGGFDEQFFMYYEDVDLCRRAWKEGFRVLYDPRSAVRHLFPYHGRPLSHQMVSLARRSMLLYIHRHRPWWEFWLLGRIVLWDCALRTWRAAKSERPSWRSVTGEIVALLRDLRNSRPASADRPWHVSNAARSGDG
jgi:GT2 family glycosyltransferase